MCAQHTMNIHNNKNDTNPITDEWHEASNGALQHIQNQRSMKRNNNLSPASIKEDKNQANEMNTQKESYTHQPFTKP